VIGAAVMIGKIATGGVEHLTTKDAGKARAKRILKRRAIAKKEAKARWSRTED
jgi:hypothetical protein